MNVIQAKTESFDEAVQRNVRDALNEDVGICDWTSLLAPANQRAVARVISRDEETVICGVRWFDNVVRSVDDTAGVHWMVEEGNVAKSGDVVCEVTGDSRKLLTAERAALNFLQLLSGIATNVRRHVEVVKGRCQILDTRKTLPGLRLAQKYAVKVGGGSNQRLGLYDGILIKENHIMAAGSVTRVIQNARELNSGVNIQIEVETIDQLKEALEAGVKSILLDNFDTSSMREAVKVNCGRALLEVSGGVDFESLSEIADTGVDRVSIGKLTNVKNDGDGGDVNPQDYSALLESGFKMLVDQFALQQERDQDLILSPEILNKLSNIVQENSKRMMKPSDRRCEERDGSDIEGNMVWNRIRTAKLIDRAVNKLLPGVTSHEVEFDPSTKAKGVLEAVPAQERARLFVRSQALEYKEDRGLSGPFEDNHEDPVENACKIEWFSLPKGFQLDMGKAEPYPGLKIELGDPVKCGCDRATLSAWNKRQMFFKIIENVTVDLLRLTEFLGVLSEELKAELRADSSDLKFSLKDAVQDISDVSDMLSNRSEALFYITCQHSRECVLQASGMKGFPKNYLRLSHASKILFEPGVTDLMNKLIRTGKKHIPKREGGYAPRGGGVARGGYRGNFAGDQGNGNVSGGYGAFVATDQRAMHQDVVLRLSSYVFEIDVSRKTADFTHAHFLCVLLFIDGECSHFPYVPDYLSSPGKRGFCSLARAGDFRVMAGTEDKHATEEEKSVESVEDLGFLQNLENEDPLGSDKPEKQVEDESVRSLVNEVIYSGAQKAINVQSLDENFLLSEDAIESVRKLLAEDYRRKKAQKEAASAQDSKNSSSNERIWNRARSAKMVERAVEKRLPGVQQKTIIDGEITHCGIVVSVPRVEDAKRYMKAQALSYDASRPLNGPFPDDKMDDPVELACHLNWFSLPKGYQLDFGKAETQPFEFRLGDPVKCGCSNKTIVAWKTRELFMRIFEQLALDISRLSEIQALLTEEIEAEMKIGAEDLKSRLTAAVKDIGDVSSMMCNRAEGLFYLTCQQSREAGLKLSGLKGFSKNYLRLAHGSKVLFEPGITDKMNILVHQGEKKIPENTRRGF
ncbi:unnamed protein product [Notodromas monacha]|uniref:Nicotinate-nucleotide pyrophosphorylase [carboxylating] n=1 Tax=Notodromas monacha TaxID=399045 RepID=A0A7R9BIX3_9CRUS|nr:unnamed protein product [Notodromas monacha]CAG0915542.1 unnamed protein product [Notodromas monacha]